jgi:hypothetical protein
MARSDWDQWIQSAKEYDPLVVAQALGASLKRTGTNEWAGPCPACGGRDRFSINTRKRVFNCRSLGEGGDVIAMVEHCTGCSFLESIETITKTQRPDRTRDETMQERADRIKRNAARGEALREREEAERRQDAARARQDEEMVAAVIKRAVPIEGTHAEAYMRVARGIVPQKRYTQDLRFVPDLDYWGAGDNGSGDLIKLAVLPALIALIRDYAGAVIGIAQTYLDPKEPRKWSPTGGPHNSAKKIRGDKKGGMIRLGLMGETLALAEGWENALAWFQLGHALQIEDLSLGAAVDLGNLAGKATGTIDHKLLKGADGRPRRIQNGKPNPEAPGVIVPDGVKHVIILGDNTSEIFATTAHIRTAVHRFLSHGLEVTLHWAPHQRDWNDQLLLEPGSVG